MNIAISPDQIGEDAPIRLVTAVKLMFPNGEMTERELRSEIERGNLEYERIGSRIFVTKNYIKRMQTRMQKRIPMRTDVADGWIYVVGFDNYLKIGFAKNVGKRLRTLQVGAPKALDVLLSVRGNMDHERFMHKRFAAHRLNGEWFAAHEDILNWIDEQKAAAR
jgi:hypothetical protein